MGESVSLHGPREGWFGFYEVEDPHGRWWRNFRAHYWMKLNENWSVHLGGQWTHFHKTLRRLGIKVSTSGEETLDLRFGFGPLGQHYWSIDIEHHGRQLELPGFRFDGDIGLTGVEWCFGRDDHSWSSSASWAERLRRNRLTWWKVGWRQRRKEEVGRLPVEVPLPEGSMPAVASLERWELGVEVGPYWPSRSRRSPTLRFWLPQLLRRVIYFADLESAEGLGVPGKGENSWDCGPDAIFSISTRVPAPRDDRDREWVAAVVAKAAGTVLRDRVRHGRGFDDDGGWAAGRAARHGS